MTLSGIVGQRLAPTPALATLPIAMMIGVVLAALPASLLMKRIGRRTGFIIGALVGGAGGGALSVWAIALDSFWLFSAGNLLLGLTKRSPTTTASPPPTLPAPPSRVAPCWPPGLRWRRSG
jgi:fucose permease